MKIPIILLPIIFLIMAVSAVKAATGNVTTSPAADSNQNIIVAKNGTVTFTVNPGIDTVTSSGTFQNTGGSYDGTFSGSKTVTFGASAQGHSNTCTITITSTGTHGETCSTNKPITFHVIVPKIKTPLPTDESAPAKFLWYFGNGVTSDGANFPNTAKFEVDPTPPSGTTLTWVISAGSSKASVVPSSNTFSATVTSTAASASADDVTITLKYNGTEMDHADFTIHSPASSSVTQYVDTCSITYSLGLILYQDMDSLATIQVLDNTGSSSTLNNMDGNESFGTATVTYSGANWPTAGTPVSAQFNSSGQFQDDYQIYGGIPQLYPTVVVGGGSGTTTEVFNNSQTYRGGSATSGQGVKIDQHTLSFRRGQARQ